LAIKNTILGSFNSSGREVAEPSAGVAGVWTSWLLFCSAFPGEPYATCYDFCVLKNI